MFKTNWNKKLIKACKKGDVKKVQECLENGADPNYESLVGWTPLSASAISETNCDQIIPLLIKAKADINYRDSDGDTALINIAIRNKMKALPVLLSLNADTTLKNNKGETAFDRAISERHVRFSDALVAFEQEKDLDRKDPQQKITNQSEEKFTVVSDTIATQYEGHIGSMGSLRTVFNFSMKTIAPMVNKTIGTPTKFNRQDPENYAAVMNAYNHLVSKNKKPPYPFKKADPVPKLESFSNQRT